MWFIVIMMLLPSSAHRDSVEVTHLDGKPLVFEAREQCFNHVRANLAGLKQLAYEHYGDTPIATIECFKKAQSIKLGTSLTNHKKPPAEAGGK